MINSASDLLEPRVRRTQALPPVYEGLGATGRTGQPIASQVLLTYPLASHYFEYSADLMHRFLGAWSSYMTAASSFTAAPSSLTIFDALSQATNSSRSPVLSARTAAQDAVTRLRELSGLTNEEIAPLIGVSRRSLQAWIAGESISARKDKRLRSLVDTFVALSAGDPKVTRRRVLDRAPGSVRPYDLLAEGRFEAALDLALHRRQALGTPAAPQAHDIVAQLSHIEGPIDVPAERLNRRLSGRLRR